MTKRFGPDGNLEPHFLRRIVHEVDILNHIGAPSPASLLLRSAHLSPLPGDAFRIGVHHLHLIGWSSSAKDPPVLQWHL